MCQSFAVAVAGGQLKAGDGWHAERKRQQAGRESQDCEGCSHLSLCEMAAADSHHPLCWYTVLWHQCCTLVSAFPYLKIYIHTCLIYNNISFSHPAGFLRLWDLPWVRRAREPDTLLAYRHWSNTVNLFVTVCKYVFKVANHEIPWHLKKDNNAVVYNLLFWVWMHIKLYDTAQFTDLSCSAHDLTRWL